MIALYKSGDIYAQRNSSEGAVIGTPFRVNDDAASSDQNNPCLSTDNNGNFIVTWIDQRNGNFDLYAQRYSRDGTTRGTNFQVNEVMGSIGVFWSPIGVVGPCTPSMCTDDNSNFVMAWVDRRNGSSSGDFDIYAQRYSSDGTAMGANFKVNDDKAGAGQWAPAISSDSDGNFVIAWQNSPSGHVWDIWDDSDIYAQRYSNDGTALGDNFKVSDDQGDESKWRPAISMNDSGNFVIAWEGDNIYAQRYSRDGTALGANFKVNDDNSGGRSPSLSMDISMDNNGNFVITWEGDGIYAQRYSDGGVALGANFKVNSSGRYFLGHPSISKDGSGNFVIAWGDERNGGWDNRDIYAQRYLSDGTTLGENFRVTDTGDKNQSSPDVKLWNGLIYTTWVDNRAGGTGYDIWANVLDGEFPATRISDQEIPRAPSAFMLKQNYPNPFNPTTVIQYQLSKNSMVTLEVFNFIGQRIKTLVQQNQPSGIHMQIWDGTNDYGEIVPTGVYFYQLHSGTFSETKKMLLMH